MTGSSTDHLLSNLSRQIRNVLSYDVPVPHGRSTETAGALDHLEAAAKTLLSRRDKASEIKIATGLLACYAPASDDVRTAFFERLAGRFDPDRQSVNAARRHHDRAGSQALLALAAFVDTPRRDPSRLMDSAPDGNAALARMPASLLNRPMRYESGKDIGDRVHLRCRNDPPDRRGRATFHPSRSWDEPVAMIRGKHGGGTPLPFRRGGLWKMVGTGARRRYRISGENG